MNEITYDSNDRVAIITLNRPDVHNAINTRAAQLLHEAWRRFENSDDLVAILAGQGGNFCAGGDISDMPDNVQLAMPNLSVPCNKPIIAAVSGYVIGAGSTMVMLSDMCVAASDAIFMYPEAKVGAFAGLMGGFPSRMPYKAGLAWTLTGDPMDANRAYALNFVNEVCPPGEQLERAMVLARKIVANAPLVVQALKKMALETLPRGPSEQSFSNEMLLRKIRQSTDYEEGLKARKDKRAPVFKGA